MNPFTKVATYDGISEIAREFNCSVAKNDVLYAGDSAGGIWIIDIADKENPVLLSYSPEIVASSNIAGLAISADGNTLYGLGNLPSSSEFFVVDVTDKAVPLFVNTRDFGLFYSAIIGAGETNQGCLLLSAGVALVRLNNSDTGESMVVAISTSTLVPLSNPIIGPAACTEVFYNMDVQPNKLYLGVSFPADFTIEMRVYDMSDPSNPSLEGTTALVTNVKDSVASTYNGFCAKSDATGFVYSIVQNNNNSAWRLLVWNAGTLSLVSETTTEIATGDLVKQIAESHNVLICASFPDSVRGFDVSDPAAPEQFDVHTETGFMAAFAYPLFFTSHNASDSQVDIWELDIGPQITDIEPTEGPNYGGTIVTLTGTNFGVTTTVTIGGVSVTPTIISATELTFVTPAHASGLVDVVVANS